MSKVAAVKVRSLMKFSNMDIQNGFNTNIYVLFEDNHAVSYNAHEIKLLRYLLNIYTLVPEIAITSEYDIHRYYNNGFYVKKTINSWFEKLYANAVEVYVKPTGDRSIIDELFKIMYIIVNDIYNNLIYDNQSHISSLDIDDLLVIQLDTELLDAMRQVQVKKDHTSVANTYDVLDRLIRTKYYYTNIGKAYIAGTVNTNQVRQLLASRGFVTEIDSSIFKYPIYESFTLLLNNMYAVPTESRSGAKALFLSNRAIQQSEYFAREMQLIVMVVEKLVDGDCGSKEYIDWRVRSAEEAGKSDITNLVGKHYLNEETGKEEIITKDDHHLEGKIIKIRSASKCKLANKNHICTACFGELSYNIPRHSNLGHICSTTLTQKISQSILSTKHHNGSASTGGVTLIDDAKLFFTIKNKDSYAFKSSVLNRARTKMSLMVDQSDAFGVKDINKHTDVYKLNPSRVSKIERITIITEDSKGARMLYPITIKSANRYGNFTYEFLNYIRETDYTLSNTDQYIIDLSGWTTTKSIIKLPEIEYNFLTLAKAIKAKFKYMSKDDSRGDADTQESLLQKVFDLVNSKLDVNLALLEVIIYAFTIMDRSKNNYDMGRNTKDQEMAKIETLINNRSLGAGYAWEKVSNRILDPRSFNGNNTVDHPLDVLIKPTETLLDYSQQ